MNDEVKRQRRARRGRAIGEKILALTRRRATPPAPAPARDAGWASRCPREESFGFFIAVCLSLLLMGPTTARADQDHLAPGFLPGSPLLSQQPASPFANCETPSERGDTIVSRITTGNNLALTIFNDGFFGNNFVSRAPSFEYPKDSDQEHLIRGGIWVGGIRESGPVLDTLVTTATIDGYAGSAHESGSEFFPVEPILRQLSILPNSRCYAPRARSEQDFEAVFADTARKLITCDDEPNPPPDPHCPLWLRVEMQTLLFSFEPFDAIVIANFKVINIHPTDPLHDLYVGFYSELASGNRSTHANFPSGWFKQKDIAWVDSLRMVSEHHFTLEDGRAPSWAGVSLLGTRPTPIDSLNVAFNWWNWTAAGLEAPKNDRERFRLMASAQIDATGGPEAPNNDPVELISAGPIPLLEAGDTLTFSVAFLGGEPDRRTGRNAEEDLAFNAGWAQTAFDLNFNIPVPPPSPDLKVIPGHEKVTLRWKDDPERFVDPKSRKLDFEGYRVYIAEDRLESSFRKVREVDVVDSIFYNTGLDALVDPVTIDGEQYRYRLDLEGLKDGFKYWLSVTSFDTGTPDIQSLESGLSQNSTFAIPGSPAQGQGGGDRVVVFPNPYRGDAAWDGELRRDRYLWFANLPPRCTIRIYTLAGDLVDTIHFDQATYHATEIRGIYDPTDIRNPEGDVPTLSGGMAAWDLVTRSDQGVANGLYLFAVEDLASGKKQLGKFLILK